MPELPEVETIRRGLIKHVVGKKIVDFDKRDQKVIQFEPKEIINKKIKGIDRRAKMLIFELSENKSILIHLKLTGQLIWESCSREKEYCLKKRFSGGHPSKEMLEKLPAKSTRAISTFDDKSVLYFNDNIRFGYMKLYDTKELKDKKVKELRDIGVEPYSRDFSVEYLVERAKKLPKRKIKQFITDQKIIAGVGNIYADEALFYAGILPTRLVGNVGVEEWPKIKAGIIKALDLGLKYGGSSVDTYLNVEGKPGEAHEHFMVYRRTGQPCKKCGTEIKRIAMGGRGTHFCPACQH